MSEEIRAAAKLVLNADVDDIEATIESDDFANPIDVGSRFLEAVTKLARAYLAEHDADEDEPLTEKWLRSVGFKESGTHWLLALRKSPHQMSEWHLVVHHAVWIVELRVARRHNDETLYSWLTLCGSSATRGQLRRVCEFLDTPLTEPGGQANG